MNPIYLASEDDRSKIMERFKKYDLSNGSLVFNVTRVGDKRSDQQRRLYWAWLDILRIHILETTEQIFSQDDLHEYFKAKFLPKQMITVEGETIAKQPSINRLGVKQMNEYMEKIDAMSATKWGCVFPYLDGQDD